MHNFYDGSEMIINVCKGKIFPLNDPIKFPEYGSEDFVPKRDRSLDKTFDFSNKCLNDLLINMENELDHNVVRKYFYYNSLRDLQKLLDKTKQNKESHKTQIDLIKDLLKMTLEICLRMK